MAEAARLADQFVAVCKSERATFKGHDWKQKTNFESSRGKMGTDQHAAASTNSTTINLVESKSHNSAAKSKSSGFMGDKSTKVICYYCKKPGHITSAYRKITSKENSDKTTIGLVSTVPSGETQASLDIQIKQKEDDVDPRFKSHCTVVTVIAPNTS